MLFIHETFYNFCLDRNYMLSTNPEHGSKSHGNYTLFAGTMMN